MWMASVRKVLNTSHCGPPTHSSRIRVAQMFISHHRRQQSLKPLGIIRHHFSLITRHIQLVQSYGTIWMRNRTSLRSSPPRPPESKAAAVTFIASAGNVGSSLTVRPSRQTRHGEVRARTTAEVILPSVSKSPNSSEIGVHQWVGMLENEILHRYTDQVKQTQLQMKWGSGEDSILHHKPYGVIQNHMKLGKRLPTAVSSFNFDVSNTSVRYVLCRPSFSAPVSALAANSSLKNVRKLKWG